MGKKNHRTVSSGVKSFVILSICEIIYAVTVVFIPSSASKCLIPYRLCIRVCLSVYLSVYLSVSLSVCLFVCLSVSLSVSLPVCLSVCLPVRKSRLFVRILCVFVLVYSLCHVFSSVKQSKHVTSTMKTPCLLDSVLQLPSRRSFLRLPFYLFREKTIYAPGL